MLLKAIGSVYEQEYAVSQLSVVTDTEGIGAGYTRNRAKNVLRTEWTCFLDDDDWLYPQHIRMLLEHAHETDADLVFPWFDVIDGWDPFPQYEGLLWDEEAPHMFPITVLLKTELAQSADFPEVAVSDRCSGEDWVYWQALRALGCKTSHLNEKTWAWRHHSRNYSGVSWKKHTSKGFL